MIQIPTGPHTWLVLWKATRAVEARAEQSIEAGGLSASDFGSLEALLHKGPLPINVLGRKLLLTTGSITNGGSPRPARAGHAPGASPGPARPAGGTDPAGRQLITPLFAQHETDLEAVVAVLTPAERVTLVALLRKLGKGAAGEPITRRSLTFHSAIYRCD